MLWLLGVLLFVLFFALGGTALRERRQARRESEQRCLSCGSTRLLAEEGARVRCEDCGFTGPRDGGGPLTDEERRSTLGPPV
ncbi:MAG: hypothetical protein R3A79_08875 [Nannocystaceae bacterium]